MKIFHQLPTSYWRFLLLWNTEGNMLKNVLATLFHTMKVNENPGCAN